MVEQHDADLLNLVRTEYRNLPVQDLLGRAPDALLGVTPEAVSALASIEVVTIFDLATSVTFAAAEQLLMAGTDIRNALYQHGAPPADLVNETQAAGIAIDQLQFLPISVLESIPKARVAAIETALAVGSVRDLALYPPHRAATRLVEAVFFPENDPTFDPERPADLIPRTGEYPTERVQYTTLLMDEIKTGAKDVLVDLASDAFLPLDLKALAAGDAGFKRIALGALLTMNQSWYAQGVTLGQLLHSASLAPGESTRIAVIDWSRKSRAGETEVVAETEDLVNDTSHNRSINEVTHSVADEAQSGFSDVSANSQSNQSGTSSAGEDSAALGGLFGGSSGSTGQSTSNASGRSQADSYSSSSGHKDIGSSMLQNVKDRTHQAAHSSRNRRASVVKEVSQNEHEGVSTRVLTNYNHMHALTVQYYEVVQVYRVEVNIAKADRVVFIPVALVDFSDGEIVRRFQSVLINAALTYPIRDALLNLDTVEVAPSDTTSFVALGGQPISNFVKELAAKPVQEIPNPIGLVNPHPEITGGGPEAPVVLSASAAGLNATPLQVTNRQLWSSSQVSRVSGLMNRSVLRAGSTSWHLPTDLTIESVSVVGAGAEFGVELKGADGTLLGGTGTDGNVALSQVSSITLSGSSTERDLSARVVLTASRNGVSFPIQLPEVTIPKGSSSPLDVMQVNAGGIDANLQAHLMANRMYYSQAIFRSLDSTQIALLLSGFGIEVDGKLVPVAQVVEPRPVRYVGNYLAFKMNSDSTNDEEWIKWLHEKNIKLGESIVDIVPLASGGTFAEAVLGRSNSAEKLDITRFWNWQDSPLPLQPTEIAAIQTGSRATPEDVKPGQLGNPVVSITSPTTLPDPVGTAAVLAAIQNGSMFRDMSGLQTTIGLAQAALQATAAGASTAGQQAGSNMNALLQANTERQRIAGQMIASLASTAASAFGGVGGGGGGVGGAGGTHSEDGAKINYFDKTQRSNPQPDSAGGGAATPIGGDGASGGGQAAATDGGGYSQNPAAIAATWPTGEPLATTARYMMAASDPVGLIPDAGAVDSGSNVGAKKSIKTKELNLVGTFEWSPKLTDAEEVVELTSGRWSPSTADWVAVVRDAMTVQSFGEVLGAILSRPDGSISRLNVFTHANAGEVVFNGSISKKTSGSSGANVSFPGYPANNNLVVMNSVSLQGISQPGAPPFVAPKAINGKKEFTIDDIRKKFAAGAKFVLYACHTGQSLAFLHDLSGFFAVEVVGFTPSVFFYPPAQPNPNKFQRTGTEVGIGTGARTADWRGLDGDPQAVHVTP